jgi:hypothetical protein
MILLRERFLQVLTQVPFCLEHVNLLYFATAALLYDCGLLLVHLQIH